MTTTPAPLTPRLRSLSCLRPEGFRTMAYAQWGQGHADAVTLCVHGLTRTGRDFDALAARLVETPGRRVLCPDVLGRGRSDWLADPMGYSYPHYCADMAALIARAGAEQVDWVGTSMGGLIGLFLAATPGTPIRRLVMNDVGPLLPQAALERIKSYVGSAPTFATWAEGEAHLRRVHAPFGALSDAQWHHLATHSLREENGSWRLAYDPAIALPLAALPAEDIDLWAVWDQVRCPVLVLRGAESDLLSRETTAEMARRHPLCQVVELPNCGHAPALMDPAQIETIAAWLEG